MKKVLLASFIILVFAVTGSAQMKMAGYLGGGISMPMSPDEFKDNWKMGLAFFGSLGVEVNPMIEILGRVGYNMQSLEGEIFEASRRAYWEDIIDQLDPLDTIESVDYSFDGGGLNMIEFGVDVKFKIPMGETGSAFQPYLIAGSGMVNIGQAVADEHLKISGQGFADDETVTYELQSSVAKFAANFGAGFTYLFTPTVGAFVDARYAMIFTEGETTAYLPIRGGVAFLFGGTGE